MIILTRVRFLTGFDSRMIRMFNPDVQTGSELFRYTDSDPTSGTGFAALALTKPDPEAGCNKIGIWSDTDQHAFTNV